jgi:hypothetical protein
MECPQGCGDMEQLLSLGTAPDEESADFRTTVSSVVYERCRECGHEETLSVETHEEEFMNIL